MNIFIEMIDVSIKKIKIFWFLIKYKKRKIKSKKKLDGLFYLILTLWSFENAKTILRQGINSRWISCLTELRKSKIWTD